jgi:threonine/homoserine/homoserine lactone efflux protein
MITACAPIITDVPIIVITLIVTSELAAYKSALGYISITGAMFISYLAYKSFTIKRISVDTKPGEANSISKSAIVNFLSPNPYIFWISVGSPMILQANEKGLGTVALFLAGFYVCLIGGKSTVGLLAYKAKDFLQGSSYLWLMRFLGLTLLIFAGVMLRDGLALI